MIREAMDAVQKVEALVTPRNLVIVGATDKPGSWATRIRNSLQRNGAKVPVYAVNPTKTTVWGETCYSSFADLPEAPDHLIIITPARDVVQNAIDGARAGARSATIFATGFGEGDSEEGRRRREELERAIAETGLVVCGPNCMGNSFAKSQIVTNVEERKRTLKPGPIALCGQSGGIMVYLNQTFEERGLFASYFITSGNELGLTTADYIRYFATDPEIKVIVFYVESIRDIASLKDACRIARQAGKEIVAFKLGQSKDGQEAAMAHTGRLAGSAAVFDAVMSEVGVLRPKSLDDLVELVELLAHAKAPAGPRLAALTLSGAFRGLLLDAAAETNLSFVDLQDTTQERVSAAFRQTGAVSNPIDGGFSIISSLEAYLAAIRALNDDDNVDAILVQEALPRENEGSERAARCIREVQAFASTQAKKPIVYVTMAPHGQSDISRSLRAECPNLPFLQEAMTALRVIDAAVTCHAYEKVCEPGSSIASKTDREIVCAVASLKTLDERQSKNVLESYGINAPAEQIAEDTEAAVKAAKEIGYPVVLKAIAPNLIHKTEVGGVVLNLKSDDEVRQACLSMAERVSGAAGGSIQYLVCDYVSGGIELAMGIHRDPEAGLVAMLGAGGVYLELFRDVTFAALPLTPAKAAAMIGRLKVKPLIDGYRGAPPCDRKAIACALMALSKLAEDRSTVLESIDINPFIVQQKGGLALDASIIVRDGQAAPS